MYVDRWSTKDCSVTKQAVIEDVDSGNGASRMLHDGIEDYEALASSN